MYPDRQPCSHPKREDPLLIALYIPVLSHFFLVFHLPHFKLLTTTKDDDAAIGLPSLSFHLGLVVQNQLFGIQFEISGLGFEK